jgi:hypothetical protein
MDLEGHRLAVATSWRDGAGRRSAIHLIRNIERPRLELVAIGRGDDQVYSPSFDFGFLFFVRGAPACTGSASTFVRHSLRSGDELQRPAPPVSDVTFDARAAWYSRCPVGDPGSAGVFRVENPFDPLPGPPPPRF